MRHKSILVRVARNDVLVSVRDVRGVDLEGLAGLRRRVRKFLGWHYFRELNAVKGINGVRAEVGDGMCVCGKRLATGDGKVLVQEKARKEKEEVEGNVGLNYFGFDLGVV